MTAKLAKELFDTLLNIIQENGFMDVLTFAIPESSENTQFAKFEEDYSYISTETELANLIALSNSLDGAEYALSRLVNAARNYFSVAQNIPERYATKMKSVFKGTDQIPDTQILLAIANGVPINLNEAVDNESIQQVISILNFIDNNGDVADDIFLNQLDQYLTGI